MEIMKVFSDMYDSERLYSVLMSEDELILLESLYSDGEKTKKRKSLKDFDSSKGIKRTYLSALMTGGGSVAGRIKGEEEADKADEEGASDTEIIRRAGQAGGKRGALVGAAGGSLLGIASSRRLGGAAKGVITGGTLGYLGGRNSSRIQTRDRLRKRAGTV